jgi:hypothetical protein
LDLSELDGEDLTNFNEFLSTFEATYLQQREQQKLSKRTFSFFHRSTT